VCCYFAETIDGAESLQHKLALAAYGMEDGESEASTAERAAMLQEYQSAWRTGDLPPTPTLTLGSLAQIMGM